MPARDLDQLIGLYQHQQRAENRARGTVARYQATFTLFDRFLGDRPRTSQLLTTETMADFAIWLRTTPIRAQNGTSVRAESGIHAHLRDMRAFCRWLEKTGHLARHIEFPMPTIPKRRFRLLTDEELERLWQCDYLSGNTQRAIRNRALVMVMLDTGIRREEAANLTLKSLNMAQRRLTVIGKGNKERRVFFSKGVQQHLQAFLDIRGVDDEPLFHLSAEGLKTTFQRIKASAGLEKFHPHQLRHQFATTMVRNKVQGEYLSELMGHEDFNTTRRYITLSDDDLAAAHEAASPFLSLVKQDEIKSRRKIYGNTKPKAS